MTFEKIEKDLRLFEAVKKDGVFSRLKFYPDAGQLLTISLLLPRRDLSAGDCPYLIS